MGNWWAFKDIDNKIIDIEDCWEELLEAIENTGDEDLIENVFTEL